MSEIEIDPTTEKSMLLSHLSHRVPQSEVIPKDPLQKLEIVVLGLSEITSSVQNLYYHQRQYNDKLLKVSLVKMWLIALRLEHGIVELPSKEYYSTIFKEIDKRAVPYWSGDIVAFDKKHLDVVKEIVEEERAKLKDKAIYGKECQDRTDKHFKDTYKKILEIKYQHLRDKIEANVAYA